VGHLAPQYYTDTPEAIKRRILGIIQDWKNTLNQPKIAEAYEMLKRQGHDFPLDAVTDSVPINDRNVSVSPLWGCSHSRAAVRIPRACIVYHMRACLAVSLPDHTMQLLTAVPEKRSQAERLVRRE
jgi:hypothetical protein